MKEVNEEQLKEAIKLIESICIISYNKAQNDHDMAQINKSAHKAGQILKEKLSVKK